MTVQEMDEIAISRTDDTYIAWVRNDSIVTPNTDNDMLEVSEKHREDAAALFNEEEGEDTLPPHQEWDHEIKLELGIKPTK